MDRVHELLVTHVSRKPEAGIISEPFWDLGARVGLRIGENFQARRCRQNDCDGCQYPNSQTLENPPRCLSSCSVINEMVHSTIVPFPIPPLPVEMTIPVS